MLSVVFKLVCLVGLPLFFIIGFLIPLITAYTHSYMDPELREMKKFRAAAKLQRERARGKSLSSARQGNKK